MILPTSTQRSLMQDGPYADELTGSLSPHAVVRWGEPLAKRTTFRVGGPADVYVEPGSEKDLAQVLDLCERRNVPFFVLGRGSNLLVSDKGFRGVVICLAHEHFTQVEVAGERLQCGAGAKLKTVALEARRNNLAGLEFLEGIPGSVGGALRINAGAMGRAISDVLGSVRLMDFQGHVQERQAGDLQMGYRCCPGLNAYVALGAVLVGQADSTEAIQHRMEEFSRKRWKSQPAASSAGCVFKNPRQIPAGKLIEELGLKMMRIGGAYVSAEHANFIVNDGTATANHILELIALIRNRVLADRGIELETEIEIVGEC